MTLSHEYLVSVLAYDKETGAFTRKSGVPGSKYKVGEKVGTLHSNGQIVIRIKKRLYQSHRLAVFYVTGAWPAEVVDHINGNRSDNRFDNLRCVSQKTNTHNKVEAIGSNKSTGLLGVHLEKGSGRYIAHINVNGKYKNLGRYDTADQAQSAYIKAKSVLHDGFVPSRLTP